MTDVKENRKKRKGPQENDDQEKDDQEKDDSEKEDHSSEGPLHFLSDEEEHNITRTLRVEGISGNPKPKSKHTVDPKKSKNSSRKSRTPTTSENSTPSTSSSTATPSTSESSNESPREAKGSTKRKGKQ